MDNINSIIERLKKLIYNESNNLNFLGKILSSLLILLVTMAIAKLVHKLFKKFLLNNSEKLNSKIIDVQKSLTITSVIDNTLKYIIYFLGLILIMEQFGVSKSLSVGFAGIGGVALGFGAQSLVKDVISGIFIIFEGQYGIGDNVLINNTIAGNVVEFGMKTTKIKGFDGSITTIGNGNITTVKNMSQGNQRSYVEITIPDYVEISSIEGIVENISQKFKNDKNITVKPYLFGVTEIGINSQVKITIIAWTKPGKQSMTELKIRELFLKEIENIKK